MDHVLYTVYEPEKTQDAYMLAFLTREAVPDKPFATCRKGEYYYFGFMKQPDYAALNLPPRGFGYMNTSDFMKLVTRKKLVLATTELIMTFKHELDKVPDNRQLWPIDIISLVVEAFGKAKIQSTSMTAIS